MTKGPGFNLDYNRAQDILRDYSVNGRWLKSLIGNLMGGKFADNLDYRGLKYQGNRIKGVAKKIVSQHEGFKNLETKLVQSKLSFS